MGVPLAHPEGYNLIPEVVTLSKKQAKESGEPFQHLTTHVAYQIDVARSTGLMEERIRRVYAIARAHGYDSLVLGAWAAECSGMIPSVSPVVSGASLMKSFWIQADSDHILGAHQQ